MGIVLCVYLTGNKFGNLSKKKIEGVSLPMNDNIWLQINLERNHECVILNNNNKSQPYKNVTKGAKLDGHSAKSSTPT